VSDLPTKPRVTVRADTGTGSSWHGPMTQDSVQNFAARVGLGAGNLLSQTEYTYQPLTRLRQKLEWMYRASWIVGAAVDVVGDDMTRAGVQMNSDTDPDDLEKLKKTINDLGFWNHLNSTIKWSRLYGGCLMAMMIDGQNPATPLVPESISEGALRGFLVIDRWMVQPTYMRLVEDFGPDYGLPMYYDLIQQAPYLPNMRIHYSRVLRMDGLPLPFNQRLTENHWGMSVLERLNDRLVAFDSGTMGTAQLLYKAYLRTYKVKDYRSLVAFNSELTEKFHKLMELMRVYQSNEGLTVIDADDEFETHAYSFAGLSETLMMLGQQLSGALGIPLVRLFGQSPAGMNATGESDLRNYYDMIGAQQEARLRRPLTKMFDVLWRSTLGSDPPDTFAFTFNSLYQMNEMEKAEVAQRDTDTVKLAHDAGIITTEIALKEMKQSSILTGRFTNITDQDIKDSAEAPPPWEQPPAMPGIGAGMPGAKPNGAGGAMGAGVPAAGLKAKTNGTGESVEKADGEA
jgi:phage-related protein (TIGR01555 family)